MDDQSLTPGIEPVTAYENESTGELCSKVEIVTAYRVVDTGEIVARVVPVKAYRLASGEIFKSLKEAEFELGLDQLKERICEFKSGLHDPSARQIPVEYIIREWEKFRRLRNY